MRTNAKFSLIVLALLWGALLVGAQEKPEGEPVASVVADQLKIEFVLQELTEQTGINIIAKGKTVGQRISVIASDEPIETILDKIVSNKPDWIWHKVDDTNYEIMDRATYQSFVLPEQTIRKTFQLQHILAEDAQKAIQGVLTKGIGTVAVDQRTNKLFVTDLPQVIELISRILEELDVKVVTRVFYIKYADPNAVADMIETYKSPPGQIEVDPKTHQIIVTDSIQNIKRMEMLIEVLDIGPEIRVYDITNIGKEGKEMKDLLQLIQKEIATKDAFVDINFRTGKLIVEDMPEVHEKIEQLLEAFDQPVKQVLIEAEVVETKFESKFTWGVEYDISQDLPSAVGDGLFTFPFSVPAPGAEDYGFINLRDEFPAVSVSEGITVVHLSKHIRAQLNAALSDSDTRVLLQPRLIVKNHEEAKIDVGQDVPYLTARIHPDSDRYYTDVVAPDFVRTGLRISLTPSISNNGLIEMEVDVENSGATDYELLYAGQTYNLVGKDLQKAKSVLIIPSGETRVIGGLIRREKFEQTTGIPVLVRIPVIGPFLFGNIEKSDVNRNILFFITPTIVEETGAPAAIIAGELVERPERKVEGVVLEQPEELGILEEVTTPALASYPAKRLVGELNAKELSLIEVEAAAKKKRITSFKPQIGGPTGVIGEEAGVTRLEPGEKGPEPGAEKPPAITGTRPPRRGRPVVPPPKPPQTKKETNY